MLCVCVLHAAMNFPTDLPICLLHFPMDFFEELTVKSTCMSSWVSVWIYVCIAMKVLIHFFRHLLHVPCMSLPISYRGIVHLLKISVWICLRMFCAFPNGFHYRIAYALPMQFLVNFGSQLAMHFLFLSCSMFFKDVQLHFL